MCVQTEIKYLIYNNNEKCYQCVGGGLGSAPECADFFTKRVDAEKQLIIINDCISKYIVNKDNVIKKCKITYEVFEETAEEIIAEKESRPKYTHKDTYCCDCFYEKNESYDSGQECSNKEISPNLKERFLDNEECNCPHFELVDDMD